MTGSSTSAAGTTPKPAAARVPTQQRSRERVERMLTAASELIERGGSDTMKMSEVAERAGVPIGSLYQFFPDKGAVIRTLAERYNALGRECIAKELAPVATLGELGDAFARLVDIYYAMFLAEPVMRDIWSGTQADKALQEIDLADSRATGGLLATALGRVRPDADRGRIATKALLVMNLGVATMRLAITVGRAEGAALVEAYKAMALRELAAE
jgi:AcrR family transcriptional regulator